MIVCTKCGLQNDPSDSFCGSCGSFLEWTGTKVEEPAPAPAPEPIVAESPVAPEQQGFMGRVRDAVGLGDHGAGPAADASVVAAAEGTSAEAVADPAGPPVESSAVAAPPPTPVVVSGPKVFRIVDDSPALEPEPAPEPEPEPAPTPELEPEPEPNLVAPESMIREAAPAGQAAVPSETLAPLHAVETMTAEAPDVDPPEGPLEKSEPLPAPPGAAAVEALAVEPGPSQESLPQGHQAGLVSGVAPGQEPTPGRTAEPTPAPEPTAEALPDGPICSACGRANPKGRVFCISCGERLPALPAAHEPAAPGGPTAEPASQPVVAPPPASADARVRPMRPGAAATAKPRPLVQPARPVEVTPTVAAVAADQSTSGPAVADPDIGPAQTPPQPPQPPVQPPAQPPARVPIAATAAAAATVAATTAAAAATSPLPTPPSSAPAPPDQPAARRPEATKPGPERPRSATRPAQEATPAPNPGDLVCDNCGIGNDPARKFCRRCGQSLATAAIAPALRVPWYRRIFGPGRPKQAVAAGERPKSMRTDGRTGGGPRPGRLFSAGIQVILLAGVIGIVVGYAIVPSWRDAVNGFVGTVKEAVMPSADPVYTTGPTEGPGIKGHPARLAFDRTLAFWAAPFVDGAPPVIEASFAPPAETTKLLVTAGASGDQYKAFARPRDVTFEFIDAKGAIIAAKSYELKDQADPQPFDVGATGATRVRLTVRSIFPAEDPKAPVAVSEVEFFGSQAGAPSSEP